MGWTEELTTVGFLLGVSVGEIGVYLPATVMFKLLRR
jgi:hypothetical protein